MRNVQVIDGAENCTFPVYEVDDRDFALVFPAPGQNIEFAQDLAKRLGGEEQSGALVMKITARHADKTRIAGIHGTLFVDTPSRRKYFPNKRESDVYLP